MQIVQFIKPRSHSYVSCNLTEISANLGFFDLMDTEMRMRTKFKKKEKIGNYPYVIIMSR